MKLFILSLFTILSFSSNGQYGNFWNTRVQKNPAFQVLQNDHFANVNYRDRLSSLSGKSESTTVSYGTYLKKIKGGIGFYYNRESLFNSFRSNSIKLAYNYQLDIGKNTRVSFGTGIGVISSKIDFDKIIFHFDHVFPTSGTSMGLDLGTALAWKKLAVGVGLQNILKADELTRDLNRVKHLNLTAQYTFGKKTGLQFIPQTLIETDTDFTTVMLNGKVGYKNTYFISGGIILDDHYLTAVEILLYQNVRLTYSFQWTVNKINKYTAASHEVGVCVELGKRALSKNPVLE